jgi:hypothetical protein
MIQKHRISTNIGVDQKITVELKQDFDVLEILSLKFSQQEIYTSMCSDYGVVCGRVTANNGFGLGNVRVSIFVPLSTEDQDDPVISKLYPYKEVTDKDENNYRYNLLPSRQQHGGHNPTGTFPDQNNILSREEILEVYEKYYKYTVKTNSAGDFMIWGVPVGAQTIHIDADLSDVGCFSLRPYDFIRQGKGVDNFKNKYSFKSSEDFNSLPQIVSIDRIIQVYPFWGNESLCEIGISRSDFDLTEKGVKIQPKAFLIGGIFTDTTKNAVNKNCTPRKKMGRKCDMTPKSGKIEALRFTPQKDPDTHRPYIEIVDLHEDIPDDGGFVLPLEMNMDYVFTNEFGENEITNDPNKGVPTSACYRLRINMNDNGLDRVRANADFLIPNIREYSNDIDRSYAFSTDYNDYPTSALPLITNNVGGEYYPQDYFYRFNYNKVYSVSSFHKHFIGSDWLGTVGFANINEAHPSEEEDCGDKLTPPTNFGKKNYTFTLLIADFLLLLDYVIKFIYLSFLNFLIKDVLNPIAEAIVSLGGGRDARHAVTDLQISTFTKLSLFNYPECQECDSEFNQPSGDNSNNNPILYCSVGQLDIVGGNDTGNKTVSNENYFTSVTCNSLNLITNRAFFIANQTNYKLYNPVTGYYTVLDNESYFTEINGNLIFVDAYGGFTPSGITYTGVQIYDLASLNLTITQPESGCDLYDTLYDDSLITGYYVASGTTGASNTFYGSKDGRKWLGTLSSGIKPISTSIGTQYNFKSTEPAYSVSGTISRDLENGYYANAVSKGLPSSLRSEFKNGVFYLVLGTQSTARLTGILKEYYRRKRVGKMFCGGIVNYGFVDNWLSGSLYFPLFKVKKAQRAIDIKVEGIAKYCRNFVRLVIGQSRFYYRSAQFNGSNFTNIIRPTTFVDLGPRDEFIKEICVDPTLDPNCSVVRSIGATSYHDLGELLGLAINYRMDIAGAGGGLDMFFQNTGFTFTGQILDGDILQLLSTNNETGIEGFDLESPRYIGYQFNILDPEEYPNFFKVNGDWGPLPVTLELNEDGYRIRTCLNEGSHIDYNGNFVEGRLTESSQPVPFYLWDKKGTGFGSSGVNKNNQAWDYGTIQLQPLQGMTYGYTFTGGTNNDSDPYALLPMTNNSSGVTISNLNLTNDVEFETISNSPKTIYDDEEYPGYTYLYVTGGSINGVTALGPNNGDPLPSGKLYIRVGPVGYNSPDGIVVNGWQNINWNSNFDVILPERKDYYSGNKQILSTPFQFYFGLMAGKTGLDKFIDLFGPKGAFPPVE